MTAISRGRSRRITLMTAIVLLGALLASPAGAQDFSTADLEGTWRIFQLATPQKSVTAASINAYQGQVSFDADGAVTGAIQVVEIQSFDEFDLGGSLAVSAAGVVTGILDLTGLSGAPDGQLVLREARMLENRRTIIGAAAVFGKVGLFVLAKVEPTQTFNVSDISGATAADPAAMRDWAFYEVTPSNDLAAVTSGDTAAWVTGSITFAGGAPSSAADLELPDGSVRASRDDIGGFGPSAINASGIKGGFNLPFAGLVSQLSTDAAGTPGAQSRDLILGRTSASDIGAPGMAALVRLPQASDDITFDTTDLGGAWRIFVHRVHRAAITSTTQIGDAAFDTSGDFVAGNLRDASNVVATFTPTGMTPFSVDGASGTVTGAFLTTAKHRYEILGTMRVARDVIVGVVTAHLGTTTRDYGLVVMIRDQTRLDLSQSSYAVAEGNSIVVTVLRSGNLAAPVTVNWSATGGTAGPADLTGPTSGTLTFGSGVTSQTFTLKTAANTLADGDRTVNLVLSDATGPGAALGNQASAPLTIQDQDVVGTVKLSAATYSVGESGKTVTVVIQRQAVPAPSTLASDVVVTFSLTDGTAQAGRDYRLPASTTVTLGAGATSAMVPVPIIDTGVVDGPRTFTFTITGVSAGGAIGDPPAATITITDNDVAGSLQFSAAAYSTNEPAGASSTFTVTVTRTGGTAGGVLVDFATADGTALAGHNYEATGGTLTFDAGTTSRTFTVTVLADGQIEGDRTVRLTLANPRSSAGGGGTGAPKLGTVATALLTIRDAQKGLQFSDARYSAAEASTTVKITVLRTGPLTDQATVRYSTSDGVGGGAAQANVHYVPTSGVLTFKPNAAALSFGVKIMPDRTVSAGGPRTLLLLLSDPTSTGLPAAGLGPLSTAVLAISDTDKGGTIKLSTAAVAGSESAGTATVVVTRAGGTAGQVTIDYATSDAACVTPPCPGIAQAGLDYEPTSGTLTFGPGETSKTLPITVFNDPLAEGPETFRFTVSNAQGGGTLVTPTEALVTIADNDQGGTVQLSAATYSVMEPETGTATVDVKVTRVGTGLSDGASVILLTGTGTAVAGTNYQPLANTLVFGAGEKEKTVSVTIHGDPTATGNLTVPITLINPTGGATLGKVSSATLTIIDFSRSVRFSLASYSVNEGGTATITVLRGGAAGAFSVQYTANTGDAQAGVDYTPKTGTLNFAATATSVTFTVTTKKSVTPGSRTVNLTLGPASAGDVVVATPTASLTIEDIDGPGTFQFAAPSHSVNEGASISVPVTRTGGVGGTVVIPWAFNPPTSEFTPASGSLTFKAGASSASIALKAANPTTLDGNRAHTLELGAPSAGQLGTPATTLVNIMDRNTGGVIQFAKATDTVAENLKGGLATVLVSRANPSPTAGTLAGAILVDYTITGDVAAVSEVGGFAVPTGTLTFPAAASSVAFKLGIVNGAAAQLERNVVITLSNPRSAGGAPSSHPPTIGPVGAMTLKITGTLPRVQLAAANFNVVEGEAATIGVTRVGPTTGTVTVQFATADGTAVAGDDYTASSGTLTVVSPGRSFTVPTHDNGVLDGGHRTVLVTLSDALGASLGTPSAATLTIHDRQSAGTLQFASPTASVQEGGVVRVTVSRMGSNLVGGVTIGWSATGGTATAGADFSPSSGTLTFGPGVTSQSFDITAAASDGPEGTETIILSLEGPTGGAVLGTPASATVFVVDGEQTLAFASGAGSVGETLATASVLIVRSGVPTGTVGVTARTVDGTAMAGQDYVAKEEMLTFEPGEIVKPFVVTILKANAASRNGNRALTIELSDAADASLMTPDIFTLTILDFRPDLVIASVATPSDTLAGKTVAAPSTVRNLGLVPAPPFRIGVFMVRADAADALVPGAGSLVATQDVPSLAAGGSATFPTQVAIADAFPAGDYYVSAIANFGSTVLESNPDNNGLSSAPSALSVKKNLTKFKSASGAFSQSSPAGSPTGPAGPLAACDVTGDVDLTGTFQINNQLGGTASGLASLTGTLNDSPVQYGLVFTGTGDDNGNVSATLNSVEFRTLTPPLITGSGTGSLTGTLDGRVLRATVSGQFTTSGGGDCVFTGTLEAQAQTSFQFAFGTALHPGSFGFGTTPSVTFPVAASGYGVGMQVFFDTGFPDPGTVTFTGPAGSGVSSVPADEEDSEVEDGDVQATYIVPDRPGTAPGGRWSVLYKGVAQAFTVPPFNPNSGLVLIYPTVTVDGSGLLTQIDWVYRDRVSGAPLAVAPSFVNAVVVEIQLNGDGNIESGLLGPSTTTFSIAAPLSPPQWSQVRGITFTYSDLAGNRYELEYGKAFTVQVEARLENVYASFTSPGGSQERLLNVFVDVPSGSVSDSGCQVTVQNQNGTFGQAPYDSPTCLFKTGSTVFPGSSEMADIFSDRVDLNSFPSPLAPGTVFQFSITPISPPTPQIVSASLMNPEADPATDFIMIPNPSTPTLKPSGTSVADARLGQNQTISWTRPSFPVRELFVSPIVNTTASGGGVFCHAPQPAVTLDSTQATFRLPTTCSGQPVESASICIFYRGEAGELSSGCWFFQDPS